MPKIAVSYRRSDSSAIAGRIFDRLAAHYGRHNVFMDVDDIPIGVDFRSHIDATLRRSTLLLAVMGARWTGAAPDGAARIGEPDDPVRVELETALSLGAPIVPVLVDGAKMPDAASLPESLRGVAFLNAAEVATGRNFDGQIERLIQAIDKAADAGNAANAAIYASSKAAAWRRFGLDAARFFLAPTLLLLVAHYLVVLALDLKILFLQLAAALAPFAFGAGFALLARRSLAAAFGFGVAVGLAATAGMTVVESLATGDPLLPETRQEWLDNFQFAASIALSFVAGAIVADILRRLPARLRPSN